MIAVIARSTNLLGVRTPSRLELSYLQSAADLTAMIATGDFPPDAQRSAHADSPRVGDGFVRVDERGLVTYASPNALSVYRRLGWSGDLDGHVLADVTRELVPPRRRPDEETLSAVLGGRVHRDTEVGDDQVSLIVRAIPLRARGGHVGALVLVRDVTDMRRRDRELVTKDATIREIHHRVKNNLQTVAALLRLQARRIGSDEARAALEEAVRRVGSIAIVHETLSQEVLDEVAFDEIADRLGAMVTDVGGRSRRPPRPARRTPGGLVRPAAQRDGHRAGDGPHRAAPERRRARLPGKAGGHDLLSPRSGSRAGCGSPSTTTGSAFRTGSTPRCHRTSGCRSCGPWSSRSWAACWSCGPARASGRAPWSTYLSTAGEPA